MIFPRPVIPAFHHGTADNYKYIKKQIQPIKFKNKYTCLYNVQFCLSIHFELFIVKYHRIPSNSPTSPTSPTSPNKNKKTKSETNTLTSNYTALS